MAEVKLVIDLPDECDLGPGTITMPVERAREWALSILDLTPPGITTREQAENKARITQQTARDLEQFLGRQRDLTAEMKTRAGHIPLRVDKLARTSGLFRNK